jgi:mRNA-degrading endonuclease RelE of RelBE toxin-antitoxin system
MVCYGIAIKNLKVLSLHQKKIRIIYTFNLKDDLIDFVRFIKEIIKISQATNWMFDVRPHCARKQ